MMPTPAEIIAEIETGPLAAELARLWAWVFETPTEPQPTAPDRVGAWQVKRGRAGRLHPDAAFEIHRRLAASGRLEALGWTAVPWKLIKRAKDGTMPVRERA